MEKENLNESKYYFVQQLLINEINEFNQELIKSKVKNISFNELFNNVYNFTKKLNNSLSNVGIYLNVELRKNDSNIKIESTELVDDNNIKEKNQDTIKKFVDIVKSVYDDNESHVQNLINAVNEECKDRKQINKQITSIPELDIQEICSIKELYNKNKTKIIGNDNIESTELINKLITEIEEIKKELNKFKDSYKENNNNNN